MKHFSVAAALIIAPIFASTAFAQDDGIDAFAGFDTVSEYVFRGQSRGAQSLMSETRISLSDNFAIPALNGFSGGALYIAGVDPDSSVQRDEIRAYVNYSVPLDAPVSVDVGANYFYYPQAGGFFETRGGSAGSYEVYGGIGLDQVFLSPKAKVFYDVTLENLTIEGSLEHGFDLPREGWSGNLRLKGGYVDADSSFVGDGNVIDYGYGTATIGLNKVITKNISFYADGNFSINSEDNTLNFERGFTAEGDAFAQRDSDTKFWFGTGMNLNF